MMELVVVMMMMRLAALTVSCLSALVADGRPTQTAYGAIDPNGRPTVANCRPAQTPRGTIDPNGRPTVANGRPARTPCGAHSAQEKNVQASRLDAIPVVAREPGSAKALARASNSVRAANHCRNSFEVTSSPCA